jgi:hypothetical protein
MHSTLTHHRPRGITVALLALTLSLAGCTTSRVTYAPDGRRGFSVSCGGYLSSWSTCLVKAGQACGPRGYDVIEGSEYDRRMLIACRNP